MHTVEALRERIAGRQKLALLGAVAGLVVAGLGAMLSRGQFFQAYLFSYMFWLGMSLGCLGLVILHNLSGGDWGHATRRMLEAGTRTFPLMALLFLPILVTVWMGTDWVYEWADHEHVAKDAILLPKSLYLNPAFFTLRYAAYFAIWGGMAWRLYRWSSEMDRNPDLSIVRRLENISGPGAVVLFLTITFSAFDWVMSLEPHWYSTIYGLLFIVGDGLAVFALMIILLSRFSEYEPFASFVTPKHFHDLGKLMHAFVVLWAYGSFAQFLIIWSGNLAEEIPWYIHRFEHGWSVIAITLMVGQFAIPFLLLLSRQAKRKKETLVWIAAFILAMRLVDVFWLVVPAFPNEGLASLLPYAWVYAAALVGIGGAWFANLFWSLQARPLGLLPDPYGEAERASDELPHPQRA